jgi:hypothetical protein
MHPEKKFNRKKILFVLLLSQNVFGRFPRVKKKNLATASHKTATCLHGLKGKRHADWATHARVCQGLATLRLVVVTAVWPTNPVIVILTHTLVRSKRAVHPGGVAGIGRHRVVV